MSVDPGELSDLSCLSFLLCKVGYMLCCCSVPPGSRARLVGEGMEREGTRCLPERTPPHPAGQSAAPGY